MGYPSDMIFLKKYNELVEIKRCAIDFYDYNTAVSLREMERDIFLKYDDFHEKWEFDPSKEIFFDLKSFESELIEILESSKNKGFIRNYNIDKLL